MIRNLNALGLSLVAVVAMSAFAVSGAAAHEFHTDGARTIATGVDTNDHEFTFPTTIGMSGTVKCTSVETETAQIGAGSDNTYKSDTLTVSPRYTGCTFGGQPAAVNFEHCAYIFDSDTTSENPTGGEHANVTIECEPGHSIKFITSVCTFTIGAQTIKHAARYENDPSSTKALSTIMTAHKVVVGNLGNLSPCVFFLKGEVGKYVGSTTATCFRDDGSELSGTARTTPQSLTTEGPETECRIA